jgi:uncharacterized protein (DUF2062 family)
MENIILYSSQIIITAYACVLINNNWPVSIKFCVIGMPLEVTATWNFNYELVGSA